MNLQTAKFVPSTAGNMELLTNYVGLSGICFEKRKSSNTDNESAYAQENSNHSSNTSDSYHFTQKE